MKKTLLTFAVLMGIASVSKGQAKIPPDIEKLLQKNTCLACHKVDVKLIGPAYKEVAKKKYTPAQIVELIKKPVPSNWPGYIPMAALPNVPADEALKIATWITKLK